MVPSKICSVVSDMSSVLTTTNVETKTGTAVAGLSRWPCVLHLHHCHHHLMFT